MTAIRSDAARRWRGALSLSIAGLLFAFAALAVRDSRAASPRPAPSRPAAALPSPDSLSAAIDIAQQRLRTAPDDWETWGALGLDYVQQAKVTVDPAYYPKAVGALHRSEQLRPHGNFVALAGLGALAAGRHHFAAALRYTRTAAHIAPYNSTIYGAMADALTQLGRYREARRAIERMLHLHPGTPAFSRLSYAEELAGHRGASRAALQQALEDAVTPSDVAFVRYYLGELAFSGGRPRAALAQYADGLRADPAYPDLLEGRAKAEAALGRTTASLRDYAAVVRRVPQPQYVIEYGELLQSLGRHAAARRQYALFGSEVKLFQANGVRVDLEPAAFYADHGSPRLALRFARAGYRTRPFVEVEDALAWALHRNGMDRVALVHESHVLQVGLRSALFHYHAGMILRALGRTAQARQQLATALRINPSFDPLRAPLARQALHELGGT